MNKLCIMLFVHALPLLTFSQMQNGLYGNEWINHTQQYYKFKINAAGFYSIPRDVLQRDITQFDDIQSSHFQLYYMGKQIPLDVTLQNGLVQSIDFYASLNNAQLDVNLYKHPSQQLNPSYSLYNDSSCYFLTWSAAPNQQFTPIAADFNNVATNDSFFMHEINCIFKEQWNEGTVYHLGGNILSKSFYETGEGFGAAFANQHDLTLHCPARATSNPQPSTFKARMYCKDGPHQLQLQVNNSLYNCTAFNEDSVFVMEKQLSANNINATNTIQIATSGTNSRLSLSRVSLSYPRLFDFGGATFFKFKMQAGQQKKLIVIENFDAGTAYNSSTFLYDLQNKTRTACLWDGQTLRTVLGAGTSVKDLVVVNKDSADIIFRLYPVQFENYQFSSGNYLVISHPFLMQHSSGGNPVFDYCAYRSSTGHAVSLHNIQELYDQFAYGVQGHPLAINNFVAFAQKNWSNTPPTHLFLIGKGRNYQQIRHATTNNQLIPSYGYPSSDNLLTAAFNSSIPQLSVGRLSVNHPDQILDYLDKVKTIENTWNDSLHYEHQHWRKKTLHLAGGKNNAEQHLFNLYLNNYSSIASNGLFPSEVSGFSKTPNQFTEQATTQSIDSMIKDGVSFISFFGHGSAQSFDFYMPGPHQFDNKNKYPHIFAMGCQNGTIFEASPKFSENYLLAKQKGAISYLSFVDVIFANCAYLIGSKFYSLKYNDFPYMDMGGLTKNTIEYLSGLNGDMYQLACHYMVYHGDPALQLNSKQQPDIALDAKHVRYSPGTLYSTDRQFSLEFDVFNWGAPKDSILDIKIIQTKPDGRETIYFAKTSLPPIKTSIKILIPIEGYADIGRHQLSIVADYEHNFVEQPALTANINNKIEQFNIDILPGRPIPLFPREYSIINTAHPVLKAASPNAVAEQNLWFFEIDSTPNFDSELLRQYQLMTDSNICIWQPNLRLRNNQVYYWRVRLFQDMVKDNNWAESSFLYLQEASSDGWNQSHYAQFHKNEFDKLIPPSLTDSSFQFAHSAYEIAANAGYIAATSNSNEFQLLENGSVKDKCRCPHKNGIYVAVFDPQQKAFWHLNAGTNQYGAINCDPAGRTAYQFLFETNIGSNRQKLADFVLQTIPDNHLVLLYTLNNGYGNNLDSSLTSYLKMLGATKIDSFIQYPDLPYAVSFFKNEQQPKLMENIGQNQQELIKINNCTPLAWHEGSMMSPLIGPAVAWERLESKLESPDIHNSDSVRLTIWGVNPEGEQQMLSINNHDSLDISHINANRYPYLRLQFNSVDQHNYTPSQLKYWRVYGQIQQDLSISVHNNPLINYDSLTKKNGLDFMVQIGNNSPMNVGQQSIVVHISNRDSFVFNSPAMNAYETVEMPIHIDLSGYEGLQHMVLKLSPLEHETHLANNWGWLDIHVYEQELIDGLQTTKDKMPDLKAFPNPFQHSIQIECSDNVEHSELHHAKIYDIKGTLIRYFELENKGTNRLQWDGLDAHGNEVAAGIYYCQVAYKNEALHSELHTEILKLIKQ